MEELHNLTDKEIKSLKDAVAVIKKFSNYIERVNVTNRCLQDNLDNAIKAGDVTNVQKVNLRIYERAERFGENLRENLKAQCSPSCSCSQSEQAECAIAKAYWIANLLCQVANGEEMGWEEAFYRLLNKYDHEGYLNAIRQGELMKIASDFHICRKGTAIKLQGGGGSMSVDFYRKNKRRGKVLATMGFGKFNLIRAIFQSCWNPQFGFDYYSWKDLKWSDACPPFPEAMLDLFTQMDCEGELSNEQCKAICAELEKNDTFMQRKPFPELSRQNRYSSRAWTNTLMNEPEWREEAEKFYEILKDCAKRGCGVEWF